MMNDYQVIRTHLSPYQASNFKEIERETLEQIQGVKYLDLEEAQTGVPTILITNTHTRLAELPTEILKSTKLIIHPNSGYDNFREDEVHWKSIPLVVGHEIRAQAVAEYSLSCVFQAMTELPQHLMWDKSRNWERQLIKDQEIWVLGYGHIGKIIADTLSSLGAKITIIDPFVENCPHRRLKSYKDGNISKVKIVIAACGLNETTKNILGPDFFSRVSKDLIIINGARGKIIDETALKEFLLTHPASFAFLDVFHEEPFPTSWMNFPQVWKTSHIAGVHKDLDLGILNFEEKVLTDFIHLNGQSFWEKYKNELLQNKKHLGVII